MLSGFPVNLGTSPGQLLVREYEAAINLPRLYAGLGASPT